MKTSSMNIRSLFAGLLVLIGGLIALTPFVSETQGQRPGGAQRDQRRLYYVTQDAVTGSNALTACAAGYHMASFYEIFDTSNLKYNTELGFTTEDSGFGPPSFVLEGWVRTGYDDSVFDVPGYANCYAWTSDSGRGTVVELNEDWSELGVASHSFPWRAVTKGCNFPSPVWCVQD